MTEVDFYTDPKLKIHIAFGPADAIIRTYVTNKLEPEIKAHTQVGGRTAVLIPRTHVWHQPEYPPRAAEQLLCVPTGYQAAPKTSMC